MSDVPLRFAAHEAGHATVAALLGCAVFHCYAAANLGGTCRHGAPEGDSDYDAGAMQIVISAAGEEAELRIGDAVLPEVRLPKVVESDHPSVQLALASLSTAAAIEAPIRAHTALSDFRQIEAIADRLRAAGESKLNAHQWYRLGREKAGELLTTYRPQFLRVTAALARHGEIRGHNAFVHIMLNL